jgi:hypothetical protein
MLLEPSGKPLKQTGGQHPMRGRLEGRKRRRASILV